MVNKFTLVVLFVPFGFPHSLIQNIGLKTSDLHTLWQGRRSHHLWHWVYKHTLTHTCAQTLGHPGALQLDLPLGRSPNQTDKSLTDGRWQRDYHCDRRSVCSCGWRSLQQEDGGWERGLLYIHTLGTSISVSWGKVTAVLVSCTCTCTANVPLKDKTYRFSGQHHLDSSGKQRNTQDDVCLYFCWFRLVLCLCSYFIQLYFSINLCFDRLLTMPELPLKDK